MYRIVIISMNAHLVMFLIIVILEVSYTTMHFILGIVKWVGMGLIITF